MNLFKQKKLRRRSFLAVILLVTLAGNLTAQNLNRQELDLYRQEIRRTIRVPAIDGFLTLKGDFHMHSMFSDGAVWPSVRVEEAWADGLDVIAITDHVEYRPHDQYLKADHNTAYEIVSRQAARSGILLVKAIEITKWKMPPGHMNALFIQDGNIAELNDTAVGALWTALEKLKQQGAFFTWNHPGWDAQQKDTVKWFDLHQQLYEKGFINGIEIFNFNEWYPVAMKWAMEKKLAPFANSDVHDPIPQTYRTEDGFIRPMTLVFSKERTTESLREAMFAGRTVAWFGGHMAGDSALLSKLAERSFSIKKIHHEEGKDYYEITNLTDFTFNMKSTGLSKALKLNIPPGSAVKFSVSDTIRKATMEVANWHTGMTKHLLFDMKF